MTKTKFGERSFAVAEPIRFVSTRTATAIELLLYLSSVRLDPTYNTNKTTSSLLYRERLCSFFVMQLTTNFRTANGQDFVPEGGLWGGVGGLWGGGGLIDRPKSPACNRNIYICFFQHNWSKCLHRPDCLGHVDLHSLDGYKHISLRL